MNENTNMTEGDVLGEPKTITCKLRVAVEGIPAEFRVVPHKSDNDKMVLKTCGCENHRAALTAFCEAAGIEAGNSWQGASYFIVEVTKDNLLAGLVRVLNGEVTVEVQQLKPSEALMMAMGLMTPPSEGELPN